MARKRAEHDDEEPAEEEAVNEAAPAEEAPTAPGDNPRVMAIPEPAGVGIITNRTNEYVAAYLAMHNCQDTLTQQDKETLRILALFEAVRGYVPRR